MAQILSEGGVKPTPWDIRGPRDPRIREEWRWAWEAMIDHVACWEGAGFPFTVRQGVQMVAQRGNAYPWASSIYGPYLAVDGESNEGEWLSVGELSSSGQYTLVTHLKTAGGTGGDFDQVCGYFGDADDDAYINFVDSSGNLFVATKGGNTQGNSTIDCADDEWHIGVSTWDQPGGVIRVYVDGALQYEVTGYGDTSSDSNARLGFGKYDTGSRFTVDLMQLGVYEGLWTDGQVRQFSNRPFGPFRPRERDVVQVLVGADVTLTADSGTYSVTGSDADLLRDLLITGESGSYSVSGSAADLLRSLLLDGESGSYSVSGQDADLLRDLLIDAESGSYTVVGSAADLLRALLMSGDAGTYSVTGAAADLIVSTGVTLTADPGSYSVTGADADLLRDLQIEGEPGSYTVSGQPADLLRALLFSAEAGDYTVSGQQADLLRQLVMSGGAGSYSVSGAQATLLRDLLFDAEAGSYEVSGEDAQLVLAGAFEALNIAVSVDQPLDLSASIDQPLDLDADVDQPLDMDVDVEPQE